MLDELLPKPSLFSPRWVSSLAEPDLELLREAFTPRLTKYVPHKPTSRQAAFLLLDDLESLYGGAAGGGKSDALLMAALQYVDQPNYSALILRKSYADLSLPDAIMSRAQSWLSNYPEVRWSSERKTFTFPSGATLTFGYLESEQDKYRYQGAAFQFIAFDELTQFTRSQYLYLFSRLRKASTSGVPVRIRSASNPGGIGHDWVYERFMPKIGEDGAIEVPLDNNRNPRRFIPARLQDNPYLDYEEYVRALSELDAVTREQLLNGDWKVRPVGGIFKPFSFSISDERPSAMRLCRYWDMAATADGGDWTVGALLGRDLVTGYTYILDIVRLQGSPAQVETAVATTAGRDGKKVPIRMEQEPGSSGLSVIDYYSRRILYGYDFRGVKSTGSKVQRAMPIAAQAERGNVRLLRGDWNSRFLDEAYAFPEGVYDDQVDAVAGAFSALAISRDAASTSSIASHEPAIIRHGDLTLRGDRYKDKE